MILYKYRSLENFERILDIILNQRLYCSTYPELNDPFEGIFETTRHLQPTKEVVEGFGFMALSLLKQPTYNKVEDFFGGEIDKIKICSLSSDLNDVRLWSYYADGHKGIVFEIDFSGLETKLHEVHYSDKLPWGVSPQEVSIISGWTKPHDVLSRKTNHWKFESEYRIIEESQCLEESTYFGIKGRIKTIYLGTRTSDIHRKLLNSIVPSGIPIYMTNINKEKVVVESGKCIEERTMSL